MPNRYVVRARVSEAICRRLLRHPAVGLTAGQITQLPGLNRNTANRLLARLHERMIEAGELERPFCGHVEVDESYFGPRRVKGKAGRGAGRKIIVFRICSRHGQVDSEVVECCSNGTILSGLAYSWTREAIAHGHRVVGRKPEERTKQCSVWHLASPVTWCRLPAFETYAIMRNAGSDDGVGGSVCAGTEGRMDAVPRVAVADPTCEVRRSGGVSSGARGRARGVGAVPKCSRMGILRTN